MSADLQKNASNGPEKMLISQEQQTKINEVRRLIGPPSNKASVYCSDASIARYLRSQNWNVKKAVQMLQRSLKWREEEYKPEEIRWEDVADEAEAGVMYTPNYCDKHGRTIIIMKPGRQNSVSIKGQIRYFVYLMEKAIFNLPPHQEEIVWLIDMQGYSLTSTSFKASRETNHILGQYYPQRLGLAIMYNGPKILEPFYGMMPFFEPGKFKFGYSNDQKTKKMMEDLFDMDRLESTFGGKDETGFDINKYAERMKDEDKKMSSFWAQANTLSSVPYKADSGVNKENIDCSLDTNPDQSAASQGDADDIAWE